MLITSAAASRAALFSSSNHFFFKSPAPFQSPFFRPFSSASPYPLYYELIHHHPVRQPSRLRRRDALREPNPQPDAEAPEPAMDRSKRKYYRKRAQRMFGGDSDSDDAPHGGGSGEVAELKPEVVDFPRLHAREQELYFHDAFAFPWEKDKHYRMVYRLEKKYFPGQSLDKSFVDPEVVSETKNKNWNLKKKKTVAMAKEEEEERDERPLVFFDDGDKEEGKEKDVSERKVQEFFKCLKKFPSGARRDVGVAAERDKGGEPFLVSRRMEMPPRWDGPYGTVVLVDIT